MAREPRILHLPWVGAGVPKSSPRPVFLPPGACHCWGTQGQRLRSGLMPPCLAHADMLCEERRPCLLWETAGSLREVTLHLGSLSTCAQLLLPGCFHQVLLLPGCPAGPLLLPVTGCPRWALCPRQQPCVALLLLLPLAQGFQSGRTTTPAPYKLRPGRHRSAPTRGYYAHVKKSGEGMPPCLPGSGAPEPPECERPKCSLCPGPQ